MRRFGKRMMEGSFGAGILKGRRGWIGVPGVVHVTERRDVYVKNKVNTNSNKFLHINKVVPRDFRPLREVEGVF